MSPFVNKGQARAFFAKEARGEMKPGTAKQWAAETPGGIKSLPERGKKRTGGSAGGSRKSSAGGGSFANQSSNSISAPMRTGIASRLPDLTTPNAKAPKRSFQRYSPTRPLTLPRKVGNPYARRGTPRSQMRSYGRTS